MDKTTWNPFLPQRYLLLESEQKNLTKVWSFQNIQTFNACRLGTLPSEVRREKTGFSHTDRCSLLLLSSVFSFADDNTV